MTHALGRPRDQERKRRFALPQRLHQRRNRRALRIHQAFLLRDVEIGGGAGGKLLLDQIENAGRAGHVFARDAQAILRRQHLEISVGDAHHGGQADHLAVIAAGDRALFGGAQGRAVLAPEVDLVAGGKRGRQQVALRSAKRTGGAAGGGRLRTAQTRRAAIEGDAGQERRAGDARLRVGLHDLRDRRGDVEIGGARLFDERGQFLGAENRATSRAAAGRLPPPPDFSGRARRPAEYRARDRACRWQAGSRRGAASGRIPCSMATNGRWRRLVPGLNPWLPQRMPMTFKHCSK